jgi:hypothetical protein
MNSDNGNIQDIFPQQAIKKCGGRWEWSYIVGTLS